MILQTYVEVPDRPKFSNRGVFPGGPKALEILIRVGVLCLGGTQPGVSQVPEHPDRHAKGGYPAGAGRPKIGCRVGLGVLYLHHWRPQRCGAGSSTDFFRDVLCPSRETVLLLALPAGQGRPRR